MRAYTLHAPGQELRFVFHERVGPDPVLMRAYTLHAPGQELRFVFHELVCEWCRGHYTVSGVTGPGARGLRSAPSRLCDLERVGGWPCSCVDVTSGERVTLPPQVTP